MRSIARAALVTAAAVPLVFALPATASAAEPTDVSYAFAVDGSTVTNTITNNSGSPLSCSTALAPAPGGVLPPIMDVIGPGQSLYENGTVEPGATTQSVVDVPDGSYVALASCGRTDTDPAMWVSDYPGLAEILAQFPTPSFAVQQASPVVTVPGPAATPSAPGGLPDLGALFGS